MFWPLEASYAQTPDFALVVEKPGGRVRHIGDDLSVNLEDGRSLSLAGLYIPPGQQTKARRALSDTLIGHDVNIHVSPTAGKGRTDRYGRRPVHLVRTSDHIWIQGTILQQGLALVFISASFPQFSAELYAAENHARKKALGLWANNNKHIHDPESILEHKHSFQIVEGIVFDVADTRRGIFLNFAENWRDDFTILIPPRAKRRFAKAGVALDGSLTGAHVRVRGWVQSFNGPLIEITHPAQLELLQTPLTSDSAQTPGQDQKKQR